MQRRPTEELLDTDSGTPSEVAASLNDLRWFNRYFGGISTTRRLIEIVARGRNQLSVLEIAAGDGFVPKTLREKCKQAGVDLKTTLLDRAPSHLPRNGSMRVITADALALPFNDSSFDVVSSSLFVHHLEPEQVVFFAQAALRICRVAVLVNDLVRHPLHLAVAYAGLPLYRSRLTRHDAPASVRQAYTVAEMRNMLEKAGARRVEINRQYFFRMGAVAWKDDPGR
jgi:ubiquinone/menaquinone biosynthesis C-methylase UbiE